MQQTETYKLNLLESTDPFSPAPLNENAQKAEAQFAALHAADARHCLDKLAGPLSPEAGSDELNVDLSGFNLTQYSAIIMLLVNRQTKGSTELFQNGTKCVVIQSSGTTANGARAVDGASLAVFFPGDTIVNSFYSYGGIAEFNGYISKSAEFRMNVSWKNFNGFQLKPLSETSSVTLYGLRA